MSDKLLQRFAIDTPQKKKYTLFLLAALLLGVTATLVTYPGIFYSDSYGRWFLAKNLARFNFEVQDDWLSVPPQLYMAALYKLTQNTASFTLLQSVLFFFTGFCAIDRFCPKGKWAIGAGFVLCPIFYGWSVFIEMSVLCLVALLWLAMLIMRDHSAMKQWRMAKKVLYFLACFLLYFTVLGFRQNAFTMVPVLAVAWVLLAKQAKTLLPLLLHGGAVATSMVLILSLPTLLNFGIRNGSGSLSTGFLWETVTILGHLPDEPPYDTMLDYLGEEGTTRNAVENNNLNSIYGYHPYIPNVVVGEGDNARRIREDYFYLMRNEPAAFWRVKGQFAARALGLSQPLDVGEYTYDFGGRMHEFGMLDTDRRQQFHGSVVGFLEGASVVRRPWVWFTLAAGLLAAAFTTLGKKKAVPLLFLYGLAVSYYASFLITTQSQEFRYFFLPLVLLYLVAAGSLGALAARGWAFAKGQLARRRAGVQKA